MTTQIDWLLASDPAISWQAMRDLADASPAAIAAERARVAREGIGADILARQGPDGSWHRADAPDWLPTLFTLLLLRATGVDRAEPGGRVGGGSTLRGRASAGTRNSARSRSSKGNSNRALTAARWRLVPTSGARRRGLRAVSPASHSTTAVGICELPKSSCLVVPQHDMRAGGATRNTSVPSGLAPGDRSAARRARREVLARARAL